MLFYQPGGQDSKALQATFQELGEKFGGTAGLVDIGAVNCGRQQQICQQERVQSLPTVMYFGPGELKPSRYSGDVSFKSLSGWVPKVMADFCKVLPSEEVLRKWLVSDDKVPHVVFFSDRKSTPPLLKTLSLEFKDRAALGIVLAGAEAALASKMGVDKRPALVHVLDEETLQGNPFDKDFKKEALTRFISKAVAKHRSAESVALKELTPTRFSSGECSPSDSNFCLLLVSTAGSAGDAAKDAFRQLAKRLAHDPVKVFFVRNRDFLRGFGAAIAPGRALLYRPKRKRFKLYEGDTSNVDELAAFVESTVGGGAPLPETLEAAPSMRAEL